MLVIYAIFSALAAFAAYVSAWPLFVLVPIGLTLSLVNIVLTRRSESRAKRIGLWVVNGFALVFHLVILAGFGWIVHNTAWIRYAVPENYMGDVFVIHDVSDGSIPESSFWGMTYHIPENGIYRSQSPMYRGLARNIYYRERAGGILERIQNYWPTTIDRTPENLSNNTEVGVFFPRTGSMTTSSTKCPVEYDLFYVGTKAYLLSGYREKDLSEYLAQHPVKCPSSPADPPLKPTAEKRGG